MSDKDIVGTFLIVLIAEVVWVVVCSAIGLFIPDFGGNMLYLSWYLWPMHAAALNALLTFSFWNWDRFSNSLTKYFMGLVGAVFAMLFFSHQLGMQYDRQLALKNVTEVQYSKSQLAQGFKPRFMPYPIAEARVPMILKDTQGISPINITYIADSVHGDRWTVIADGNFGNPTKGVGVIREDGTTEMCPISVPAVNGFWWNSLTNAVRSSDFTYFVVSGDIYGDCVDHQATIVVPLQHVSGLDLIQTTAGVAVFDASGHMTIYQDEIPNTVYGPVYPMSLAEMQRESMHTGDNWWSYLMGLYGYVAPGGDSNPNQGNNGEFNLPFADGKSSYFVSPLTPAGASQSLVGFVAIASDRMNPGHLNPMIFARYDTSLNGLQTVADTFTTKQSNLNWAAGIKVLEVVPGPVESYVGYVGKNTVVTHIFQVYPDGRTTIQNLEDVETLLPNSPAPVTSTQEPSGSCEVLWQKLQIASSTRSKSEVLRYLSELESANCK